MLVCINSVLVRSTTPGTALAYIWSACFIASSSLAAAIAAGVGGGGVVCPGTGAAARASPSTRPAADKMRIKLFIPILLDFGVSAVQQHEFPGRPPAPRCWPDR